VGAFVPSVAPTLLARPLEHRPTGEHRPGTAPHELVRLVGGIRSNDVEEPLGTLAGRRKTLRGEEDAGLADPEARNRSVDAREIPLVELVGDAGPVAAELDRPRP